MRAAKWRRTGKVYGYCYSCVWYTEKIPVRQVDHNESSKRQGSSELLKELTCGYQ
jgi:hypothetical protein